MQPPPEPADDEPKETTAEKILRLDVARCPKCEGKLIACPLPLPKHPP